MFYMCNDHTNGGGREHISHICPLPESVKISKSERILSDKIKKLSDVEFEELPGKQL